MLCLIKSANIFSNFCRNIYAIEYQKCDLLYIYLFIFFNSANKFLEAFDINEIIYSKLLLIKTNLTGELIRIVNLVIFYGLYKKINLISSYKSNTQDSFLRCIKYYLYNFFEETFIQENGYQLY